MLKKENIKQEHILKAIYKHKALSVKQLQILFGRYTRTLGNTVSKLKAYGDIKQLTLRFGIYYYLTTQGIRRLGGNRVKEIKNINEVHTSYEIKTIRNLLNEKIIRVKTFDELLDCYKTDREIKNLKYSQLGGKANKYRYVDLLVKTKDGLVGYEIEITKKERRRYKHIILKLEQQASNERWKKIVWIIHDKDVKWFKSTLEEYQELGIMTFKKISTLRGDTNGK